MLKEIVENVNEASILQKAWDNAYLNAGTTKRKFDKLPCEKKLEIAKDAFRNAEMSTPVDKLVADWKKNNC